jgi:DNA-binding CsgD family transcriptional regulator
MAWHKQAPDDGALIDAFYEAAAVPELWPDVLDRLARFGNCRAAVLFATDGAAVNSWTANAAGRPPMELFLRDGWMARNPMAARGIARGLPDFIGDYHLFTQGEIDTDPFYRDFMRPNGLAWLAGTLVSGTTDNHILVSMHRPYDMGPVAQADLDQLTKLRPHIARATFMAARLRLEQVRAAVEALSAIGLPAAALTAGGGLRLANDLFQALMPDMALDWRERLKFTDRDADGLFERGLAALSTGIAGLTFPVPASGQGAPIVAHLLPIRGSGQDIFSGLRWLLIGAPVARAGQIDSGVLQGLFDLTVAEARVAKGIVGGDTLDDLAERHGLGRETVRSQLKGVMAKTGTRRQVDLVRLLAGAARWGR